MMDSDAVVTETVERSDHSEGMTPKTTVEVELTKGQTCLINSRLKAMAVTMNQRRQRTRNSQH